LTRRGSPPHIAAGNQGDRRMTAPDDWIRTALAVTGHFEDSDNPMAAVTDDFDGMGVSLGVLQWNFGSMSLQPIALAAGEAAIRAAMPTIGADFLRACKLPVKQCLALVRTWQPHGALTPVALAELRRFTGSDAFVAQQVKAAGKVAATAWTAAQGWAASAAHPAPVTKREFAWFFDLFTQNGGLKGLDRGDVDAFIAGHGAAQVDDFVANWLSSRPASETGFRDSRANATRWRGTVAPADLPLFALSFLRAGLSRPAYRGDVFNRKATIAVGSGWVHRELHDLTSLIG
jgi:hypothetical protein